MREVEHYLLAMKPSLGVDLRTRIVARALLKQPAPSLPLEPFRKLVMSAGLGLLPDWAANMHGVRPGRQVGTDTAVRAVRNVTAWALKRP